MLTVKIMSDYSCLVNGKEETKITKTRIIEATKVDVDMFPNANIVTIGDNELIVNVPHHIDINDWKGSGVTTAVYVENEKGKTTQVVKAFQLIDTKEL